MASCLKWKALAGGRSLLIEMPNSISNAKLLPLDYWPASWTIVERNFKRNSKEFL